MNPSPDSIDDLARALAGCHARGARAPAFDLGRLARITAHVPEDMTVTVQAGIRLDALQRAVSAHGQWLPVDPLGGDELTVGALIARDASGPRRFGHGTVRDHLLGLTVVLADGRVVHSGGAVVKNVAGFDLLKLFVGSQGTLGLIVAATFKLLPRPEAERWVSRPVASGAELGAALDQVAAAPLTPVVLDAVRSAGGPIRVVLGFAGTPEDVSWQTELAAGQGFAAETTPAYEETFWGAGQPAHRISVLPSRLPEAVGQLGETPFVARAGNGVLYHRGPRPTPAGRVPDLLEQRVKALFDPRGVFPSLPVL